jgi:arsenite methyltransferase
MNKADYGIDAPYVIRNLLIAAAAGFAVWLSAATGLWSGRLAHVDFAGTGLGCAIGMSFTGLFMWWSSKYGKVRARERLLRNVAWRGDEQVLDVGCGRGLMLIGAAQRLRGGRAIGIDIWQTEDLSGNDANATLENARREGVADRVEVQTADMRKLPFPDAVFDVIVSRVAIHNVYERGARADAIREVARVLKPGGHALIDDIRHYREYTRTFAENGCSDVRRLDSPLASTFWTLITFGSLQPATLLVTKSA